MSEVIGIFIRQRLFQIDLLIFRQKFKKCRSIMHIFVLLLRKSSENYHAFYSSTCGKKAANRTVRLRPWYYYPTYMGLFSGLLWMSQCALDDYSLSFFALLFVHFYWLFSVVVIVFQTLRAWQKNYISWLHQKRNSFIGKRFGGKKVVWPLFWSKWKYVHCKYLVNIKNMPKGGLQQFSKYL